VPVSDNVTNRLIHLEGALGGIFTKAMDWAEDDFRREIEAEKWGWPRETKRRSGPTVGSPRDIVDLGGLRNSQKRENISEDHTAFVWTGGEGKAYALEVHDGYSSKAGNRMPARPFTEETIAKLDEVISDLVSREVKNG
jgi:hypothetical protein